MNGNKDTIRFQQINDVLFHSIKTIYRLRKVGYIIVNNKQYRSYVISLKKSPSFSLEVQVLSVYNHLQSILLPNETLVTENKCFKIISDLYEAEYYVEAWRKRADKLAYVQDGNVVIELLYRMGCEQAAYIFNKHGIYPFKLLDTSEPLQEYNNAADKYVALAKSCKAEYKE